MSEAKKCDRCGKLYECYKGVEFNKSGFKYNYVRISAAISFMDFDLCEPCMTELVNWLKEGGK